MEQQDAEQPDQRQSRHQRGCSPQLRKDQIKNSPHQRATGETDSTELPSASGAVHPTGIVRFKYHSMTLSVCSHVGGTHVWRGKHVHVEVRGQPREWSFGHLPIFV